MNNIYQGEDAPCLKCTYRHVGCHGKCAAYMDYQKRREVARENRDKIRQISEEAYFAKKRRK